MYFDYTYLIFIVPAMLLALWAQTKVNSTFNKYSKVISARRMTGREAARRILDANGLHDVQINRVAGNLTDHLIREQIRLIYRKPFMTTHRWRR